MDIQDLDVFIDGVTQVIGALIEVDILLKNQQRLTLTEELRKFKIKNGLFSIEIRGRFNYVRIARHRVDIIKFSIRSSEVIREKRTVKDTGSGDGEEGVGAFNPKVVRDKQDPERKRDPYNIR